MDRLYCCGFDMNREWLFQAAAAPQMWRRCQKGYGKTRAECSPSMLQKHHVNKPSNGMEKAVQQSPCCSKFVPHRGRVSRVAQCCGVCLLAQRKTHVFLRTLRLGPSQLKSCRVFARTGVYHLCGAELIGHGFLGTACLRQVSTLRCQTPYCTLWLPEAQPCLQSTGKWPQAANSLPRNELPRMTLLSQ